jgi:hypothetical protein
MPIQLPNEILNLIFSFIQRPLTNKIMKYVIEDCYEEDYDPYTAEYWYENYCFEYSFKEWYFLYRKNYIYKRKKNAKYKHMLSIIPVGADKINIIN